MLPTPIRDIRRGAWAGPRLVQAAGRSCTPGSFETVFGTSAKVAVYAQQRAIKSAGKFSAGAQQASRGTASPRTHRGRGLAGLATEDIPPV
jgi:hypothetical protein